MKRLLALLCALLLLSGCGAGQEREEFTIACTTYPVYLLANTNAGDVDGVSVRLVVDQQVSCLHDYTLTVTDMKVLEGADVVAINGAGLEDFLGDALDARQVIDLDEDIDLIATEEPHAEESHSGDAHHHDGADPHIWMDPRSYAQMARTLSAALAEQDPAHADTYQNRGEAAARELERFCGELLDSPAGAEVRGRSIITFHDGFAYFARAFGLTIAAAIEEEEGAEASAQELRRTIEIVERERLPAVFTEVNGSANAAGIIARECGVAVYPLSMVMSGEAGDTIAAYERAIQANLDTIRRAYP